ncbi:histidine phosphatase family protein [Solibacillus isronensis]|uniref:histidine phosphatase family protein n=1 Tax=Solibacillus isronensis TaxID=412383 RepID=UPI002041240E|nr:histidine phosphatase family protein [Solibacillus isronensis]MCM3721651.1 histidine phosphatase family protein [Solibacillus isronensis]
MSKIINYYRHGETVWNKEGRLQGWLDSELTTKGIDQATSVNWNPEIVFSSDLKRAVQTARLMFPDHTIHKIESLREINLGHWQGSYIKDLQQDEQYYCYLNTPHLFINTTQESFEDVTNRMIAFHEYLLQLPYERIAVVSHGVAIACLMSAFHKQPYNELWGYLLDGAGCFSIEGHSDQLHSIIK